MRDYTSFEASSFLFVTYAALDIAKLLEGDFAIASARGRLIRQPHSRTAPLLLLSSWDVFPALDNWMRPYVSEAWATTGGTNIKNPAKLVRLGAFETDFCPFTSNKNNPTMEGRDSKCSKISLFAWFSMRLTVAETRDWSLCRQAESYPMQDGPVDGTS